MTFKATALATLLSTASATTCQSLCESLESCASDPNAKGSYCKTDESPQACFGLYYKDASLTTMCFQPNDTECSETYPIICPEAPKALTCQDVCKDVETCREDPHAHGSYCKFEETNPICFGMSAILVTHIYCRQACIMKVKRWRLFASSPTTQIVLSRILFHVRQMKLKNMKQKSEQTLLVNLIRVKKSAKP